MAVCAEYDALAGDRPRLAPQSDRGEPAVGVAVGPSVRRRPTLGFPFRSSARPAERPGTARRSCSIAASFQGRVCGYARAARRSLARARPLLSFSSPEVRRRIHGPERPTRSKAAEAGATRKLPLRRAGCRSAFYDASNFAADIPLCPLAALRSRCKDPLAHRAEAARQRSIWSRGRLCRARRDRKRACQRLFRSPSRTLPAPDSVMFTRTTFVRRRIASSLVTCRGSIRPERRSARPLVSVPRLSARHGRLAASGSVPRNRAVDSPGDRHRVVPRRESTRPEHSALVTVPRAERALSRGAGRACLDGESTPAATKIFLRTSYEEDHA